MSDIIVFGGHGQVALLATRLLADRGDRVTSVIRDEAQSDDVREHGGTPVVADVEGASIAFLAELIGGHDTVVWSAGAGGGSPERTYAVDRDAAIFSVQAAAQAGAERYVMVSWSGSRIAHGVDQDNGFCAYAQAKAVADAVLRDSELAWTVVAPTTLTTDAPTGRLGDEDASDSVSRADVAATIAAVLADPSTVHRTIRFSAGSTPVAEFVAG